MKVDGIIVMQARDDNGILTTTAGGFLQRDDTDEVTSAGMLGNAKPGRQWRPQDGWTPVEVTFTQDDTDTVDAIPDTLGRLFAVAEILATRGTPPRRPHE